MADERTASEEVFATTLGELRSVYEQVVALIQRDPHAQRSFERATALADALRQLAQHAADIRAQAAARIAKEEKLSLSVLATRIGVSKARAGQLVKSIEDADAGRGSDEEGDVTDA